MLAWLFYTLTLNTTQNEELIMLKNKNTKFAISLLTAAMASSMPAHADMSDYLDRIDVDFLLMQNFQSIQAKDGAFRPED